MALVRIFEEPDVADVNDKYLEAFVESEVIVTDPETVAVPAEPAFTAVPADPAVTDVPALPAFTAVPAEPAVVAVVALPENVVAVIVPAEKLPEASLATIVDTVLEDVAFELTVKVAPSPTAPMIESPVPEACTSAT